MKILVTGAAGFIGFHLAERLVKDGHEVIGIDNLNHYYDVRLKLDRLQELGIDPYEIAMGKREVSSSTGNFKFLKLDLINKTELQRLFDEEDFEIVFNMAAQAGVRYSIDQPQAYIDSNIVGFANLLEACRHSKIKHLVYASSSSIYGNNKEIPFKTTDNVDHPISLYAATKKSNELMAHTYSHLFNLPTTGLRFFTVYGPWGRPDMATMLFAKAILNGDPIKVFNNGNLSRDFTYVDDIVEGLVKVMFRHKKVENKQDENYRIYNLGNSDPVNLLAFIETMEKAFGRLAIKKMYPMQPGDVERTYADVEDLKKEFNYQPETGISEGITLFKEWYFEYFLRKNPTPVS